MTQTKRLIFCLLSTLCGCIAAPAFGDSLHAVAEYANFDADPEPDGYIVWFAVIDDDLHPVNLSGASVGFERANRGSVYPRTWGKNVTGRYHRATLLEDFKSRGAPKGLMRVRVKTDKGILEAYVPVYGVEP